MRTLMLLGVTLALGFAATAGLMRIPRDKDTKDEKKDPLTELVEQLGDDDFHKREEASKKLEAIGEKALPALVKGMAHRDLEIRRRSQRLILVVMPKSRKSKSTGMAFARIEAGNYTRGSSGLETSRRPDEPQHKVKINRPFYMAAYEVSQNEFAHVMKFNPSAFSAKGENKDKVQGLDAGAFPVENVTWFDAIEFCNRLSKLDGYEPYYQLTGVKKEGDSIVAATVKQLGGSGYRLPTEAEWEYACRADTATPWNFGPATRKGDLNCKPILSTGGYGSTYLKWPDLARTMTVGSHKANAWGLYDMHGNVAEWVNDWYDKDYYDNAPGTDPPGPDKGKHRVVRGGHWLVTEGNCRSAARYYQVPEEKKYFTGFRVARSP